MKPSMKALLGGFAALAVGGAAAVSVAQPASAPAKPSAQAHAPAGEQARRDPAQRQARRADMLRQRLGLRADQEPALKAFLEAHRPQGSGRSMRAELAQLTTPQRLDRRLAATQDRAAVTKRFYAVLSPEQQKAFDAMPRGERLSARHWMGRRGGPGGHADHDHGRGRGPAAPAR